MSKTNQSFIKVFTLALLLLGGGATTTAQSAVSQIVDLAPGWNIVSTPMVLDSYIFSVTETSVNFDIYALDASKPTGWATMADLGQTKFTPLFGYFINNKTGDDQTLTFNFQSLVPPNQKLFERTFSAEGWYSIGVANAEYSKSQKANRTDTNNPSSVLSLLTGKYDLVIDFSDDTYQSNRNSVALSDPWKAMVPNDINQLNDFRDTKGYAVYIKQVGARYNGFQNDPVEDVVLPEELTFSLSANSPESTNIIVDEDQKTNGVTIFEYIIGASNGDVSLNELKINIMTDTSAIENVIDSVQLRIGANTYQAFTTDMITTSADFTFAINGEVIVPEGEFVTVEVSVDLNKQTGNYSNGETIQAKVSVDLIDATIATGLDGVLDEDRQNGSAVGDMHTLLAGGLLIPVDGVQTTADTTGDNDQIGEFTIEFDVTAIEDDYYITDNSTSVGNTPANGVGFLLDGSGSTTIYSILTSTAKEDTNGVFTVREGETETFTLTVTIDPNITGQYRVTLGEVWFSANSNGVAGAKKYELFPASDFRTDYKNINAN